jgi:hypothetical protein
MIPPFKDHGYLPPGIHPATLEEVEARFGDHLMSLQSQSALEATRKKLRLLEERYEAHQHEQGDDSHTRELTIRSLKRLINQLKEEIARFESRSSLRQEH